MSKLLSLILSLTFVYPCYAIELGALPDLAGTKGGQAEFYGENPDRRFLIRVSIIGGVSKPGVYYFPDNTNLLEAISLSGGAGQNADFENISIKRPTKQGTQTVEFDFAKKDDTVKVPTLADRDMILIPVKPPKSTETLITTLTIISTTIGILATSTLLYFTLHR